MNIDYSGVLEILSSKIEGWLEGLTSMIPNIVVALLVVTMFYILGRVAKHAVWKLLNRFSDRRVVNNLFATILYFIFLVIGLLISLDVLHLDKALTSLLAGAGIVGLVLGFAFQDLSSNFIAGIIIAFRKPIGVGDLVDAVGYQGTVSNIDLRSTVIRTFQGLHVIIPNREILQNPVTNYTRTSDRRIDLEVGISYGEDLDKVKSVALEAVHDLDDLMPGRSITLFFKEFGDFSINFILMFWIRYPDESVFLKARSDAIVQIKKAFDHNDITIPFPIRTLDFGIKGGEKLSPGMLNRATK